jgi:hypothetical protein
MLLLLMTPFEGSQARADNLGDVLAKARSCSDEALKRNTLPGDPRAAAARAFDECIDQWAVAAHVLSARHATDPAVEATKLNQRRLNGSLADHAYLGLRVANDELRADYIRSASRRIRVTGKGDSGAGTSLGVSK